MSKSIKAIILVIAFLLAPSCSKENKSISTPRTIELTLGVDSEILDFGKKTTSPTDVAARIDVEGYRLYYTDNTGGHLVTDDMNITEAGNLILPDVEGDVTIEVYDYSHQLEYLPNTEEFTVGGVTHDKWYDTYSIRGEVTIPEIAFEGVVVLENKEYVYFEGVSVEGKIDYVLVWNKAEPSSKFLSGDGYGVNGFAKLKIGDVEGDDFGVSIGTTDGQVFNFDLLDVLPNQMFRYTIVQGNSQVDSDVTLQIVDSFTGEFVDATVEMSAQQARAAILREMLGVEVLLKSLVEAERINATTRDMSTL